MIKGIHGQQKLKNGKEIGHGSIGCLFDLPKGAFHEKFRK